MVIPGCRTCGADNARWLGALPDGRMFAGHPLNVPLEGGNLWRCRRCGLVFRDPLLSAESYENLYRVGALGVWDSDQKREDFNLVVRTMGTSEDVVIDVLDVGCYTGQFLASLPKSCRLYGIEANEEAAKVASSRGVKVLANTIENLPTADTYFDVITACDVIEHVPNPLGFVRELGKHLAANGKLIITTGNCDAWLWRLMGAEFWYCYFPEHISFIGTHWAQSMATHANLKLTKCIRFNYEGGTVRPLRVFYTALYKMNRSVYSFLRGVRGSPASDEAPPGNGATKDHILCVFEAA